MLFTNVASSEATSPPGAIAPLAIPEAARREPPLRIQSAPEDNDVRLLVPQVLVEPDDGLVGGADHELDLRDPLGTHPRFARIHHLPPQPLIPCGAVDGQVVHPAAMA